MGKGGGTRAASAALICLALLFFVGLVIYVPSLRVVRLVGGPQRTTAISRQRSLNCLHRLHRRAVVSQGGGTTHSVGTHTGGVDETTGLSTQVRELQSEILKLR
jgi:hypothetical protein